MVVSRSGISLSFLRLSLFVITTLCVTAASADCVKDVRGEVYCGAGHCLVDSEGTVWCSRYYEGDAKITLQGKVLCGKGQCATSSDGRVYCSSEVGGAVVIDSHGRIRCFGQCEPATTEMCESTRADNAES